MFQHGDAAVQAGAIELAVVGGGAVDELASQEVDALDQAVEDHGPVGVDVPGAGFELGFLRFAGSDVTGFLPEESGQVFVIEDFHDQRTLGLEHGGDVAGGVEGEQSG